MIRWNKVRAVARFEFVSTVTRTGYLITVLGMPVILLAYGGLISMIGLFVSQKESEVQVYALVDRAGVVSQSDRPGVRVES